MIWRDIFLDKNISNRTIINAFSLVFNIDAHQINLINNITEFKNNYLLTCIIYRNPGNFPLQLDCYVNFEIKNEFNTISHLCKILDCQILITNDEYGYEYDPWSFILFKTSGQIKRVTVDSELLDQDNNLKILNEYDI